MSVAFFSVITAFLLAMLIAGWFYYYPKKKYSNDAIIFILRTLSIFFIILLLFNPKYYDTTKITIKPGLAVVIDNSLSIKTLDQQESVKNWVSIIQNSSVLSDKFNISYYTISNQLNALGDSLTFTTDQTDFSNLTALKSSINKQKLPIILLTDGNQNKGVSASYLNINNPVYPIVFGDTTNYNDLYISQINNNPYGFLDNTFPVEIFINFKGKGRVSTNLTILKQHKTVWQQTINFKEDQKTQRVLLNLKPEATGQQIFTAKLSHLSHEKNTTNNSSKFSVEIVDQSSKVLIISDILHPDIGTLKKAIESNKQRRVVLSNGLQNNIKISDYQLIILYQPTSDFKQIFDEINNKNIPLWIISGKTTDWQYLNTNQSFFTKDITNLEEEYQAVYNPSFSLFKLESNAINDLPPLKDNFGKITFKKPHETLFYQKIKNTTTDFPLLTFLKDDLRKIALLNGEGLWQWRMYNYRDKQSFEEFDDLIDLIVQYLTANNQTDRFKITYKKVIKEVEKQHITVNIFNESIQLDENASLNFQLFDGHGKIIQSSRMTLTDRGNFSLTLDPLQGGDYSFKVTDQNTKINKRGFFTVVPYDIETQVFNADYFQMKLLAENTGGEVFLGTTDVQSFLDRSLRFSDYKNIEKVVKKQKYLINWRWLLVLIILSLTAEWFVRKYRGLI